MKKNQIYHWVMLYFVIKNYQQKKGHDEKGWEQLLQM